MQRVRGLEGNISIDLCVVLFITSHSAAIGKELKRHEQKTVDNNHSLCFSVQQRSSSPDVIFISSSPPKPRPAQQPQARPVQVPRSNTQNAVVTQVQGKQVILQPVGPPVSITHRLTTTTPGQTPTTKTPGTLVQLCTGQCCSDPNEASLTSWLTNQLRLVWSILSINLFAGIYR